MVTNVKWKYDFKTHKNGSELVLNIKFKLRGNFFRVKQSRVVASTDWIKSDIKNHKKYNSYDEYEKEVFAYLKDVEKGIRESESMILEYFRLNNYKYEEEYKKNQIKELSKNNKYEADLNII